MEYQELLSKSTQYPLLSVTQLHLWQKMYWNPVILDINLDTLEIIVMTYIAMPLTNGMR